MDSSPISRYFKEMKPLQVISRSLITVSAVALAALIYVHSHEMHYLSPVELYSPPAALFYIGGILELILQSTKREDREQQPAPIVKKSSPDPLQDPPYSSLKEKGIQHVDKPQSPKVPRPPPLQLQALEVPSQERRSRYIEDISEAAIHRLSMQIIEELFCQTQDPYAMLTSLKELHPKVDPSTLHPIQRVDLKMPDTHKEVCSIFSLFFMNYAQVKIASHPTNAPLMLSFLIGALRKLKDNPSLNNPTRIKALIEDYCEAYQLAHQMHSMCHLSDSTVYEAYCHRFQAQIIETLQERGSIMIPITLAAPIGAHLIALRLTYDAHKKTVQGHLINRGLGTRYHKAAYNPDKYRVKVQPRIALHEAPLEKLMSSPFLSLIPELCLMRGIGEQGECTFRIPEDFYENVLPFWPAALSYPKSPYRNYQGGESCALISFVTDILDEVAQEDRALTKAYASKHAIELFIAHAKPTWLPLHRLKGVTEKIEGSLILQERQLPSDVLTELRTQLHTLREWCVPKRPLTSSFSTPMTSMPYTVKGILETNMESHKTVTQNLTAEITSSPALALYLEQLMQAHILKRPKEEFWLLLQQLPPCNDPLWEAIPSSNSLEHIEKCIENLTQGMIYSTDHFVIPIDHVLTSLSLALSHFQLALKLDPSLERVIESYTGEFQYLFDQLTHRLVSTTPTQERLFQTIKRTLKQRKGLSVKRDYATKEGKTSWLLEHREMETIDQCEKDPECAYLLAMTPQTTEPIQRLIDLYNCRLIFDDKQELIPFYTSRQVYRTLFIQLLVNGNGTFDNRNMRPYVMAHLKKSGMGLSKTMFVDNHILKLPLTSHLETPLFINHFEPLSDEEEALVCALLDRKAPFDVTTQNALEHIGNMPGLSHTMSTDIASIYLREEMTLSHLIYISKKHFSLFKQSFFCTLFYHTLHARNRNGELRLVDALKTGTLVQTEVLPFLFESLSRAEVMGSHWIQPLGLFMRTYLEVLHHTLNTLPAEAALVEGHIQALIPILKKAQTKRSHIFKKMVVSLYPLLFDTLKLFAIEAYNDLNVIKSPSSLPIHLHPLFDRALVMILKDLPQDKQLLPKAIITHPDYPFRTSFRAEALPHSTYRFTSKSGITYQAQLKNGALKILRELQLPDGKRATFALHENLQLKIVLENGEEKELPARVLKRKDRLWVEVAEAPSYIVIAEIEKQDPTYAIESKRCIRYPEGDIDTPLTLSFKRTTCTDLEHVIATLSLKNPMFWENSEGEVVYIEEKIKDLRLRKESDQKWHMLSPLPGYILVEDRDLISLPHHFNYLMLENSEGERFVAFSPKYPRLLTTYGLEQRVVSYHTISQNMFSSWIVYRVSHGQIPFHSDPLKAVYFITLCLLEQNYQEAERWISSLKREATPWSQQAVILALLICDDYESRDHHPVACSLRTQLFVMLSERKKLTEKQEKAWQNDYLHYLAHLNHTVAYRLSKEEEMRTLALDCEVTYQESLILTTRQQDLARSHSLFATLGKHLINKPIPNQPMPDRGTLLRYCIDHTEFTSHLFSPCSPAGRINPGLAITRNFLYYYAIIRHPRSVSIQVHQELIQRLQMGSRNPSRITSHLINLLLNVSRKPTDFPTIDEMRRNPDALHSMLRREGCAERPVEWTFVGKLGPLTQITRYSGCPVVSTQQGRHLALPVHHTFESVMLETSFKTPDSLLVQLRGKPWIQEQTHDLAIQREEETLDRLSAISTSYTGSEPCILAEFKRLQQGIRARQENTSHLPYTIDFKHYQTMHADLKMLKTSYFTKAQQKIEEAYRLFMRCPPETEHLMHAGMTKKPYRREMTIYILTHKMEKLFAINPSLTQEQFIQSRHKLIEGLIELTEAHHTQALLRKMHPITTADDFLLFEQELLHHLHMPRSYDPGQEPLYLLFEALTTYRIRPEQKALLKKMTGKDAAPLMEAEAETGFGKSTTCIPLWLTIMSLKEGKATLMTVPPELLEAQKAHLQKALLEVYDQTVIHLPFDREQANEAEYLERTLHLIERAEKEHLVLLTDIGSLHQMTSLKLKESLYLEANNSGDPSLQAPLEKLKGIIKTKLQNFIDESHICFNPNVRFDYAVGNKQPIDPKIINHTCAFYYDLLFCSKTGKECGWPFLPDGHQKTRPSAIEMQTTLLPQLAAEINQLIGHPNLEPHLLGSYQEKDEKALQAVGNLERYGHYRDQLTRFFKATALQKCDDCYGLSEEREVIPMRGGIPHHNGEYDQMVFTLNYALQANLKKPLTLKEVKKAVHSLKAAFGKEGAKGCAARSDYRWFQLLCEQHTLPSIHALQESHLIAIHGVLNSHLKAKFFFITENYVKKSTYVPAKISSSSFTVLQGAHLVHAASGTPHPELYPENLVPISRPEASLKNLMAFMEEGDISPCTSHTAEEMLCELAPQGSVLIDAAAFFTSLSMDTIVELIVKSHKDREPPLQGVQIYDKEGKAFVYHIANKKYIPREISSIPLESLFIFIPKHKAFGTDTPMCLRTCAVVTCDLTLTFSAFTQASGRLRRLGKGHRFIVGVQDGDNELLKKETLVQHLLEREGRNKGAEHFQVLSLFLEQLIEEVFWNALESSPTYSLGAFFTGRPTRETLLRNLKEVIATKTSYNPLSNLRTSQKAIPINQALDLLFETTYQKYSTTQLGTYLNKKALQDAFKKFTQRVQLPSHFSMSSSETISIVDVEREAARVNTKTAEAAKEISHTPPYFVSAPYLPWDGDYQALLNHPPQRQLLGLQLYFSPNALRVSRYKDSNLLHQKPLAHALLKDNQLLFCDLIDGKRLLERITPESSVTLLLGESCLAGKPLNKGVPLNITILIKLYSKDSSSWRTDELAYLQSLSDDEQQKVCSLINHLSTFEPELAHLRWA